MSQFSRRVAVAGAATLALAASLGAAGAAAAGDPPPPPTVPNYVTSWLGLRTSASSNTVKVVNPSDGSTTKTQTLTAGKACSMTTGGDNVLGFGWLPTSSPGVGLAGGSIGVREKKTASGTSCSAVDKASGETLILTIPSSLGLAVSASLDVDLKQSSQILATATDAYNVPHYFMLLSGSSIDNPVEPPVSVTPANTFLCNNPADSGPDSGTNNNCRWEISAPSWTWVKPDGTPGLADDGVAFKSIALTPLVGSFSLMGGADGFVDDPIYPMPAYFSDFADASIDYKSDSIFEMVEGTVTCEQTVQLRTGPTVLKSEWTRMKDLGTTDNTGCAAYPYASRSGVDSDGSYVELIKPLDFEPNSQATWVTTGTYTGGTIPTPTMDLTGDEIGAFTLQACNAAWYNSSGVFTGPTTTSPPPSNPYACLISVAKGKGGGSTKTAIYSVYVFGDARLGW